MKKILLLSLLFFVVPVVGMNESEDVFTFPVLKIKRSKDDKLLDACGEGDLALVKKLVEEEKVSLEGLNLMGLTPLMNACSTGKIDIVKYLIENGAQLEATDRYGNTCLYYAYHAIGFHLDLIKYLSERGVDMNGKVFSSSDLRLGENVLHDICRNCWEHEKKTAEQVAEYIEYFVEKGVNLYEKNEYEKTPYDYLEMKNKHLLRKRNDHKAMMMNKIVLIDLGYKHDKSSTLSILSNDVINEIKEKGIDIGLSSVQAQIWKPVCEKANELYNQKYNTQYNASNENMNIVRILTWPKERRKAISKKLMSIENDKQEDAKKLFLLQSVGPGMFHLLQQIDKNLLKNNLNH